MRNMQRRLPFEFEMNKQSTLFIVQFKFNNSNNTKDKKNKKKKNRACMLNMD